MITRFFLTALVVLSSLTSLTTGSVVYNDPEVFWVRAHAAFFTDPNTNQQIGISRLSNDQLRSYLRDNRVREQVGLETTELRPVVKERSKGPALIKYYKRFVTQKDLDYVRNTFDRLYDPLLSGWRDVNDLTDTELRSLLYDSTVRSQLGLDSTKSEYLKYGTSQEYKRPSYVVTAQQVAYIRENYNAIHDPTLNKNVVVADLTNQQIARLLQEASVRQATGIDEAFPPTLPPTYGPIRKPAPYVQSYRVSPATYDTQWVYSQSQRLYDNTLHKNYRADYYGDENLNEMLRNQRVRYQPWGTEKYYD